MRLLCATAPTLSVFFYQPPGKIERKTSKRRSSQTHSFLLIQKNELGKEKIEAFILYVCNEVLTELETDRIKGFNFYLLNEFRHFIIKVPKGLGMTPFNI